MNKNIEGVVSDIKTIEMTHGNAWGKKSKIKGVVLTLGGEEVKFPNSLSISQGRRNPILNQKVNYQLSQNFARVSEGVGDNYASCIYTLKILSGDLRGMEFKEEYQDMEN